MIFRKNINLAEKGHCRQYRLVGANRARMRRKRKKARKIAVFTIKTLLQNSHLHDADMLAHP
jgi:hypothetical protein